MVAAGCGGQRASLGRSRGRRGAEMAAAASGAGAGATGASSGWELFDSSDSEDEDGESTHDATSSSGGDESGHESSGSVLALLEREGHHHLAQTVLLTPGCLSLSDLLAVRRASRFWREAGSDDVLWRARLVELWRSRSYVDQRWRDLQVPASQRRTAPAPR